MEKTARVIRNRAEGGAKTLVVRDGVHVETCYDSGELLRTMFGEQRVVSVECNAASRSGTARFCYKVKAL